MQRSAHLAACNPYNNAALWAHRHAIMCTTVHTTPTPHHMRHFNLIDKFRPHVLCTMISCKTVPALSCLPHCRGAFPSSVFLEVYIDGGFVTGAIAWRACHCNPTHVPSVNPKVFCHWTLSLDVAQHKSLGWPARPPCRFCWRGATITVGHCC
jgi:hypothetical protein